MATKRHAKADRANLIIERLNALEDAADISTEATQYTTATGLRASRRTALSRRAIAYADAVTRYLGGKGTP